LIKQMRVREGRVRLLILSSSVGCSHWQTPADIASQQTLLLPCSIRRRSFLAYQPVCSCITDAAFSLILERHTSTCCLQDRAEVISRAREAGVAAIIVTGCTVASATAARDLCEAVTDFPLFFTAGVHPHNAKDCDESTLEQLTELAKHERCVAIGAQQTTVYLHTCSTSCCFFFTRRKQPRALLYQQPIAYRSSDQKQSGTINHHALCIGYAGIAVPSFAVFSGPATNSM
jgi:hypothetical protein